MNRPTTDTAWPQVRIEPGQYAEIRALAGEERRSVQAQVAILLEKALADGADAQ